MTRTSDRLVDSCMKDVFPDGLPVYADYFGLHNQEHYPLILGVYQGLIKFFDVDSKQLHKALVHDRLDEFIHEKFNGNETGYYKMFKEKKIKIQKYDDVVLL